MRPWFKSKSVYRKLLYAFWFPKEWELRATFSGEGKSDFLPPHDTSTGFREFHRKDRLCLHSFTDGPGNCGHASLSHLVIIPSADIGVDRLFPHTQCLIYIPAFVIQTTPLLSLFKICMCGYGHMRVGVCRAQRNRVSWCLSVCAGRTVSGLAVLGFWPTLLNDFRVNKTVFVFVLLYTDLVLFSVLLSMRGYSTFDH